MGRSLKDIVNLEKQFTFYASYHHQAVNVAIHLLCIWPILASGILMMQYTPGLMATPSCFSKVPLGSEALINVAFIVSSIYMLCYVVMEPLAGSLGAAMVGTIYLYSGHLVHSNVTVLGYPIWQVALAVHIAGWILQFIGHGVFEGRAPALLDSLDQALLTAPLFVLLEILFFLGYRKNFHDKIMKQVEINVRQFKSQKNK